MSKPGTTPNLPTIPLRRLAKKKPGENRIGVMAGGGPCSGVNDVALAIIRSLQNRDQKVIWLPWSWDTIIAGGLHSETRVIDFSRISDDNLEDLLKWQPGTKIGTSRSMLTRDDFYLIAKLREALGISALVGIGGDGTARWLQNVHYTGGIPCIDAPKTMDNDMSGSDITFWYMTAREVARAALFGMVGELQTSGWIGIVELYGRNNGRLTAEAAALVSPNIICLVPEHPMTRDEFLSLVNERKTQNKGHVIIAASEWFRFTGEAQSTSSDGATDGAGNEKLAGVSGKLAELLACKGHKSIKLLEPRITVRSAAPIKKDVLLCKKIGKEVARLVWNNTFWLALAVKQKYDLPHESVEARIISRPLHEVAEWNFLTPEEFDVRHGRLKPIAMRRANVSHFWHMIITVDRSTPDSVLRERDRHILAAIESEKDTLELRGGLVIPRGVVDCRGEKEATAKRKSRTPVELPTIWKKYVWDKLKK